MRPRTRRLSAGQLDAVEAELWRVAVDFGCGCDAVTRFNALGVASHMVARVRRTLGARPGRPSYEAPIQRAIRALADDGVQVSEATIADRVEYVTGRAPDFETIRRHLAQLDRCEKVQLALWAEQGLTVADVRAGYRMVRDDPTAPLRVVRLTPAERERDRARILERFGDDRTVRAHT